MSRFIEKHQTKQILGISQDRMHLLKEWIFIEIEDALAARKPLEAIWRECLKMYNGIPKLEVRDIPIPNAPNIEVTIGAIASDTIYAQATDLIWNITPLVTVRPKPKFRNDEETVAEAKALQRWVNHIATASDMNLRGAADSGFLDDVQLGTGLLYTPYVQKTKKTKTAKVLSAGPRFYAVPPEDCIIAGGSSEDLQNLPLVGIRFYYTEGQLASTAKDNNWNLDGVQPLHAKNWVRSSREILGKQQDTVHRHGKLFDVIFVHCCFDIDGDGLDEDLFVAWNHSGRQAMYVNFNPMDSIPLNRMVYQSRAHLFYGLGVMQMLAPFEEKLSDVHNYSTLNILLANSRVWTGTSDMPDTLKIWPGKYIPDADGLKPLEMADVYNSIWQDQMLTMQIANQRVGINEVGQGAKIPSRTPGVTAMSFLQQVNRRFTPAFDSMKACIAGALRQACYRYQERLLAGGRDSEVAMATIFNVLGYEDGNRVINVLRSDSFDEHVDMELTAASASINREADRQNAIMLTNILGQYYQRTIELIMLASNPQTPPEVAQIARKIAKSAGELIDRTIRTFDQVRDPGTFVIEMTDELNSIETTSQEQQTLMQLMSLLSAGVQQPLQLGMGGQ